MSVELSVALMRQRGGTLLEKVVSALNKPTHTLNFTDFTAGTETDGSLLKAGTSGTPLALNTPDQYGMKMYFSSSATSGTLGGIYCNVSPTGVGGSATAFRPRAYLTIGSASASGMHATLENASVNGYITGTGCGARINLVLADAAVHAFGTYYGALIDIFSNGTSSSLAATTKHAILALQASGDQTGAVNVKNCLAVDGPAASGNMIYEASDTHQTFVGSIRILVNGTPRYLHYADDQAATA